MRFQVKVTHCKYCMILYNSCCALIYELPKVYNMVTDKWGDEKKQDEEYNFVWIGINTAKDKMNMKFVDGSEAFFKPFKRKYYGSHLAKVFYNGACFQFHL